MTNRSRLDGAAFALPRGSFVLEKSRFAWYAASFLVADCLTIARITAESLPPARWSSSRPAPRPRPACRTTGEVDLRALDWHRGAAATALTPALSCRSCRPNAPFAELVCLSKGSLAEEYYAERSGNRWVRE
jgi:hypothetical protein